MRRGQRDLALALSALPQLGLTAQHEFPRCLTRLPAAAGARDIVSLPAPGNLTGSCHARRPHMSLKLLSIRTVMNWIPTLAATLLLTQPVLAEPVNINTADATELANALDGIGPAKAKAIVSYREKNGPFKSVDQLAMVEGITQRLIDKNRGDIQLGAEKGGGKSAPAPAAAPAAGKPAKPA